MKRRFNPFPPFISSSLHLFISSSLLVLLGLFAAPAHAELQAGAARVSITPDPKAMPYYLGGYVTKERQENTANGVHDACYARALVVSDGTTRCAVVSLDLCFLPANVKTAVVSRLGASGIAASAVFLSATHSHSAPEPLQLHNGNTVATGKLPTYDPKLTDWIADRIAQAILEANGRLRPARIASGQMQNLGLNRNRRGEKTTDDEMTALKVTDADGNPLAAIFDYAAHPVYFGANNLQVSGDWVGTFERQMEAAYPGAVVLFLNGAEGDASANGSDEGTPVEKIEIYAAKLGAKARRLYDSLSPTAEGKVAAWTEETALGSPIPHPLFLLAAVVQFGSTQEQARDLVNRMMPTRCEVSFVRLGDLLLAGVPGEPTTSVGLAIKALAKERGARHPAVVALTNGWLGYLVSGEQYKAGKYEATMSFYGEGIAEKILAGVRAGLARY